MRLLLIAFALSALASSAIGQSPSFDSVNSGSQPIRSSRFERSETATYLMQRAREQSEHRASLLRYYDSIGFDYGAPVISGNFYFQTQPRHRRAFWGTATWVPVPYGM